MAVINYKEMKKELTDGSNIQEVCEGLGIPFGCRSGVCGTCKIEVVEGSENLNELTSYEEEMGDRDKTHRLACQCVIKKGEITIKEE